MKPSITVEAVRVVEEGDQWMIHWEHRQPEPVGTAAEALKAIRNRGQDLAGDHGGSAVAVEWETTTVIGGQVARALTKS